MRSFVAELAPPGGFDWTFIHIILTVAYGLIFIQSCGEHDTFWMVFSLVGFIVFCPALPNFFRLCAGKEPKP